MHQIQTFFWTVGIVFCLVSAEEINDSSHHDKRRQINVRKRSIDAGTTIGERIWPYDPSLSYYITAYKTSDPNRAEFDATPYLVAADTVNNDKTGVKARSVLTDEIAYNYHVDCHVNPDVCENICYYSYCKNPNANPLQQTKKKGRTVAPVCRKSPNKCSIQKPVSFPHAKYQCDEYPLASSTQGGTDDAATRCVPGSQNGSAGSRFGQIHDGTTATTVLHGSQQFSGFCRPYGATKSGNKFCQKDSHGKQTCWTEAEICTKRPVDNEYKQE